mmetsp:Transcript_56613/g.92163  ORF Transcript_56613/g.92163 Transcript_56613/m.92163 type:complete len:211 (+) Transcript_56613:88-720(+)
MGRQMGSILLMDCAPCAGKTLKLSAPCGQAIGPNRLRPLRNELINCLHPVRRRIFKNLTRAEPSQVIAPHSQESRRIESSQMGGHKNSCEMKMKSKKSSLRLRFDSLGDIGHPHANKESQAASCITGKLEFRRPTIWKCNLDGNNGHREAEPLVQPGSTSHPNTRSKSHSDLLSESSEPLEAWLLLWSCGARASLPSVPEEAVLFAQLSR